MRKLAKTALCALALSLPGGIAVASEVNPNGPPPAAAGASEDNDVAAAADSVTHHIGVFHGRQIRYTATAGRVPVLAPDGSVDSQMFFVAYTMDGAAPGGRPLTFLSNGGPGAATAWLHLGGIGPRKIQLNRDGSVPPSPAHVMDNPESVLDRTDLVFIDAPGTGFSRLAGEDAKKRLLVKSGDLNAYANFVQAYLRKNHRFGSPLYLFGESFGSFRMAGLTDVLTRQGVPLKGVILLSSAIDSHTLEAGMTNDLPFVLSLPSFASVAAFHHLLGPGLEDNDALRAEVQDWATSVYMPALAKGNALQGAERATVVAGLARYTGLSPQVIGMNNLRIEVPQFMQYLNAARGIVTGRTDGRLTGPAPASKVEEPYYDPAMGALTPAFTSAASQYLFDELRYDTALPYRMYSRDVASRFVMATPGVYGDSGYPQTLSALQSTVVKNKDFRVLSLQGLYDLATPFWSMEFALDHMPLPQDFRVNVVKVRLPSGHMAYADATALKLMNDAVASFIDRGGATVVPASRRK